MKKTHNEARHKRVNLLLLDDPCHRMCPQIARKYALHTLFFPFQRALPIPNPTPKIPPSPLSYVPTTFILRRLAPSHRPRKVRDGAGGAATEYVSVWKWRCSTS